MTALHLFYIGIKLPAYLLCLHSRHDSTGRLEIRGRASDLLPDILKPAFPAKSGLSPTFFCWIFVDKNKGRLPKITFNDLFGFFRLLPKA